MTSFYILKLILYSFVSCGWGKVSANVPQLSRSEDSSKELILSLHHLNPPEAIRLGGRKTDPLDQLPTCCPFYFIIFGGQSPTASLRIVSVL